MLGTIKGRLLVIVVVLVASAVYLYHHGIKLGLDLQGGMHLVLEVKDNGKMTADAKKDATDRALKIIRTRVDEFGVEEPLIQKAGETRIIVELAGVRDEERAKQVIERAAFLEFQIVSDGKQFLQVLPALDQAIVDTLGAAAVAPSAQGQQPRQQINKLLFGTRDTTKGDTAKQGGTSRKDTTAARDTTAGDTTAQPTKDLHPLSGALLQSGSPGEFLVAKEDVDRVTRYLALPSVQKLIPSGMDMRWSHDTEGRGAQLYRRLYVLDAPPVMTGEYLEDATAGREQQFNQTVVYFTLSRRGGRIFDRVTSQHVGDYLAIVLDGEVMSAPVIRSRIGAQGQIELGQAPIEEARDLALVLRAGALPAPLQVIEERTVGPSLGADSIRQGKIAGIVGILAVILIMIGYYRFAGFLAVVALSAYVLLVLGGLAGFNATLTAPGIAGLILSIGMAVDANVLIFERIREELAQGRTIRGAVDAGFQHAMSAIVDSNLTTLITALILFQFGTGPVRGFAVTLSIGILASFFSAVFITRTLFLIYLSRKSATDTISI
jgi:preprotein translocase subunit SecD